jgi:hypothetical protein
MESEAGLQPADHVAGWEPAHFIRDRPAENPGMSSHLGPIDIDCDAPSYSVVMACARLGFQSPLDVVWLRMSHFTQNRRQRAGSAALHPWLWLFGSHTPNTGCRCGQPLPILEDYTFTFASEKKAHYLLGQCHRCRTIFWEEGPVSPPSQ